MLGAVRWTLISALVAGWLILPGTAHAIVPQVHDHGKFFKPETVKQADALIKSISERFKKDVVVETFGEIPADVQKQFNYTPERRDAFFRAWRDDLVNRAGVNGVIVLICRDQYNDNKVRIHVAAGGETLKKAFTLHDTEKLDDILADGWAKNRDANLLQGMQYVDKVLSEHLRTTGKVAVAAPLAQSQRQRPNTNTANDANNGILGWVCIGLFALLGIWLVFGLFRAFSGGGGGYAGGGPGYGYGGGYGGGGGFFSGLMGGLFGAMAGNWIYNSMFGGHSYHQSSWGDSTANAGEVPSAGQDDFGQSDQGEGFAGTSRDVDDGGGGDGGDAGGGGDGGDWGGGGGDGGGDGDWGGGGGDFGGGGGDFGGGGGDW